MSPAGLDDFVAASQAKKIKELGGACSGIVGQQRRGFQKIDLIDLRRTCAYAARPNLSRKPFGIGAASLAARSLTTGGKISVVQEGR